MVVKVLGDRSHFRHEGERFGEVGEREAAMELSFDHLPAR
jgi:hypothetical protein